MELGTGGRHGCCQKREHEEVDEPFRQGGVDKWELCCLNCPWHIYGYIVLGLEEEYIRKGTHNECDSRHGQNENAPIRTPLLSSRLDLTVITAQQAEAWPNSYSHAHDDGRYQSPPPGAAECGH